MPCLSRIDIERNTARPPAQVIMPTNTDTTMPTASMTEGTDSSKTLEQWKSACWNSTGAGDQFAFFDGVTGAPGLQLLQQAGLAPSSDSSEDAETPFQKHVLAKKNSGKLHVLDAACGNGVLTRLLHDNATPALRESGYDVLAGDISENMVKRAEEHFQRAGYDHVRTRVLDSLVRQ